MKWGFEIAAGSVPKKERKRKTLACNSHVWKTEGGPGSERREGKRGKGLKGRIREKKGRGEER
jgi:hypothetical protein